MKIKIIAVGKLKEKFWQDACGEYIKRLSRFASVEVTELADLKIPDKASISECEKIKKAEGEKILSSVKKEEIISLCIEGKKVSSLDMADLIKDAENSGKSLAFVIGGSLGLSDEVKKVSKMRISMSDMTFPHQLARVMLAEQIYRAFKINANESYHK